MPTKYRCIQCDKLVDGKNICDDCFAINVIKRLRTGWVDKWTDTAHFAWNAEKMDRNVRGWRELLKKRI